MKLLLCLLLAVASARAASWEVKVVAAVIMGEARGEGRLGMIGVGEVIHQRCIERNKTPITVVTDKGEFSSKIGRTAAQMVQRFSKYPEYAVALEVARLVCYSPEKLPGITKHANAFDHKNGHPWWAEGAVKVAVINNHAFYILP